MPADNHFNATHGIWVMSGIAAGLGISIFCRTLPMLNVGSVMLILSVTSGFRGLADSVSNPAFWVLPMGAIIGMTMAPLFSSSSLYLLVSTGIWVIFGYGNFPLNPQIPGEHWPELIIGSAVVMGLSLNICFRQLRQRNHRVRRDLERLAFQDALTGMHNRRSFTERAQQMQQRKDTPSLYFLMIDIDNFKKINDAFGHDFGDQVLKKTADIIHQHAGHHLSGRLGGEEFGMVFEGDSDAVCAFAAALVRAVHGNFYPQHAVSISVGIAELISNADLAYSYNAPMHRCIAPKAKARTATCWRDRRLPQTTRDQVQNCSQSSFAAAVAGLAAAIFGTLLAGKAAACGVISLTRLTDATATPVCWAAGLDQGKGTDRTCQFGRLILHDCAALAASSTSAAFCWVAASICVIDALTCVMPLLCS